jgi:phosphopantothenoylcysteine decarboxylase/phosphopantothenate--cysteine ligase
VLLIVSGGIAAYKALELVRLLTREGARVRSVLTAGGAEFVTALSLQALTGETVSTDLFSLTEESEMGHIALSRWADLVVVAPASANMIARMAGGWSDDLASTLLLATDKKVLVAPAMNVRMWEHAATVANMAALRGRGLDVVGPEEGAMACNEWGFGRLAEPAAILDAVVGLIGAPAVGRLAGRRALVTAGPTVEPIDPVRFIANRSSGRQGYEIAAALARLGATVTLVSGPVSLTAPVGVELVRVETACEMLAACRAVGAVDVGVFAAAVADWRVAEPAGLKLKKKDGEGPPSILLVANPDILQAMSEPGPGRPRLVVGFAAETHDVLEHAAAKRVRKGCDWIVANDARPEVGNMGGPTNEVHVIAAGGVEGWPRMAKREVAVRLAERIALALEAT